ncbi:MAG: hypothetical protein QOD28_1038, partial [Acidobacteriota bacterium]|nr:hypothetical protein [Acidobacteriota bacterium]
MRLFCSLALTFTLINAPALAQQPQPSQPAPQQPQPSQPAQVLRAAEAKPAPLPAPRVKIDAYRERAARIIGAALTSDRAYRRLAHLTDRIGHRLSGSTSLERAIEWALAEMKSDGLDNVRAER